MDATGIELLPVGVQVMQARQLALQQPEHLRPALEYWRDKRPWQAANDVTPFQHLRITRGAFSSETEHELGQYLMRTHREAPAIAQLLRFAALSILEEISYTRKDGQYLRWDHRAERQRGSQTFDKGRIYSFEEAIIRKLDEMALDLHSSGRLPGFLSTNSLEGEITIVQGSVLKVLPTLADAAFDALITSPPYANRYDYTRTYALELAMLGMDEAAVKQLRQDMVTCTVENREKPDLAHHSSAGVYQAAGQAFDEQPELQAILAYLEQQKANKQLNNNGIPRMVRNYFYEMALVIFESARALKTGAPLVMVNDNVRYGGAVIPVDLILSDFAERAGFSVEKIWVLPTGKGNSSQQMGLHGRQELRKCIYIWRR
jgi:hypothetical protein